MQLPTPEARAWFQQSQLEPVQRLFLAELVLIYLFCKLLTF